jgi:hypothetical protein
MLHCTAVHHCTPLCVQHTHTAAGDGTHLLSDEQESLLLHGVLLSLLCQPSLHQLVSQYGVILLDPACASKANSSKSLLVAAYWSL